MTNDFDDLASAYLDGQVTAAEAARVENDPELAARVSELRSVAEGLAAPVTSPDEMLRRRQIAAALDAFDELGIGDDQPQLAAVADPTAGAVDGQVVDLDRRRASDSRRRGGRAGLPRWLGVAAGLLAVVGGIGLLAQLDGVTTGSSDDAGEATAADLAASTTVAAAEQAGEAAETEAMAQEESADTDAATALVDNAATSRDAPAADDGGDGASEPEADEESAEAATTTTGGLFPNEAAIEEARVVVVEVPDADELQALAEGLTLDPTLSRCATDGTFDGEPIGFFVPITVGGIDDGTDGEVLFAETAPAPTPILVDTSCQPFE
ncbi:MAG: hypothetical protein OEV40_21815 [Acidimicrobiia bacterium]|nr:hypothetical protein [Acidimicrobiia bacterium]